MLPDGCEVPQTRQPIPPSVAASGIAPAPVMKLRIVPPASRPCVNRSARKLRPSIFTRRKTVPAGALARWVKLPLGSGALPKAIDRIVGGLLRFSGTIST